VAALRSFLVLAVSCSLSPRWWRPGRAVACDLGLVRRLTRGQSPESAAARIATFGPVSTAPLVPGVLTGLRRWLSWGWGTLETFLKHRPAMLMRILYAAKCYWQHA